MKKIKYVDSVLSREQGEKAGLFKKSDARLITVGSMFDVPPNAGVIAIGGIKELKIEPGKFLK